MSLNAQIKGTFIKMECFITKPCPSHKRSKLQRFLSSIEEVIPKSSYRKELLLNLQRLHQGPMCVSEYFKELESQTFRDGIRETNKEKMKRFVNGLRRDIQDQVELYEYSILQNVFTLALRIETHSKRKNRARKSYSPNHYYSLSWKGKAKEKHDKSPSKSH